MSDSEDATETLMKTHRKEKKDLQAQIQALKKTVAKGDKKKKKEVADEIAKLEEDLEAKHKEEMKQLEAKVSEMNVVSNVETEVEKKEVINEEEGKEERVSKAQKRREKKSQKEQERRAEIERQEELNQTGARQVEIDTLNAILAKRNLKLHDVPSDGDCLFAGIAHQLKLLRNQEVSVQHLRSSTAEVIRKQADDFLPFLSSPLTGDMLNPEQFEKYLCDLENTKVWGGQVELKALSHHLQSPIEVIQAEGPPMLIGEDFKSNPTLRITYHRHMYGLGEHYNSTK